MKKKRVSYEWKIKVKVKIKKNTETNDHALDHQAIRFPALTSRDASKTVAELGEPGLSDDSIKTQVKGLSDVQADTLMKVIYVALKDEKNTTVLFEWHLKKIRDLLPLL